MDYYVELANITEDVNTLEIKKLFHTALVPQAIAPPETENETDNEDDVNSQQYIDGKGEKLVKELYVMGKYVIDPIATDFSGTKMFSTELYSPIVNTFFFKLYQNH